VRAENATNIQAFTIYDAPRLDPILVVFHDLGPGCGRLLLECYGWAWSTYWGGMGGKTVREFVESCGTDYIENRLTNGQRRATKQEIEYLRRIVKAVKEFLHGPAEGKGAGK
jgi:hypothetical protein